MHTVGKWTNGPMLQASLCGWETAREANAHFPAHRAEARAEVRVKRLERCGGNGLKVKKNCGWSSLEKGRVIREGRGHTF